MSIFDRNLKKDYPAAIFPSSWWTHGKIFSTDEVVNTDARKSIITFQPVGVIGSIMPWNFPYWQGLRFAAPSLMIGNTIILKPASTTMQCGRN
jgi:succinate-semialdehyde dehydrogenase/glutarate-semialdehyde dehydrogenase/succinyl-CoA reductase